MPMMTIEAEKVYKLLNLIAKPTKCGGCDAKIWFVTTKNQRYLPIDENCVPHFANCPEAAHFRRPK